VSAPFEVLAAEAQKRLKRSPQPRWIAPMLATLTDEPFSRKGWLFERKLDGERCLAFRRGRQLRLSSRTRKRLNDAYPELVGPLLDESIGEFVVDGEIVAFEGRRTSFARLQRRIGLRDLERARRTGVEVFYYLFDLLRLEERDLRRLELRERKRLLERAFTFRDPLRYSAHRERDGKRFYRDACRRGWEGVIAKRADSAYEGRRSGDWLKLKCVNEQEFVIGGFTDPKGRRIGLGALLVGYYEGGKLRYAGKVGSGYDTATLRDLRRRLSRLERQRSPFAGDGLPRSGVHWVKPELVAQIRFTELTRDRKLRQPRFRGLRADKRPREVVLERSRT
jgi:DNA ligase D-like protein (predicted ligase)